MAPLTLNLSTRWYSMISFMHQTALPLVAKPPESRQASDSAWVLSKKLITVPDFKRHVYHSTHNPVTTLTEPSQILWQNKIEKQILISCY